MKFAPPFDFIPKKKKKKGWWQSYAYKTMLPHPALCFEDL